MPQVREAPAAGGVGLRRADEGDAEVEFVELQKAERHKGRAKNKEVIDAASAVAVVCDQ